MLQLRELAILRFGFRIGQLFEMYDEACAYLPPTALIIPRLADHLPGEAKACGFAPHDMELILGIVNVHRGLLANAGELVDTMGTRALLNQLQKCCRNLKQTARTVLRRKPRPLACLMAGLLLAQSGGNRPVRSAEPSNFQSTWEFHQQSELKSFLASLDLNVEQITGLPPDISTIVAGISSEDERYEMYNPNRWGWGWIENWLNDLEDEFASTNPEIKTKPDIDESKIHEDLVETSQISAYVRNSNKTIFRWLNEAPLILPFSEGGGGKATLWLWSEVRERIAMKSRRDMPKRFTGNATPG